MNRPRVYIALCASALLIIGAIWFRYSSTHKQETQGLVAINQENIGSAEEYNQAITDYLASASGTSTAPVLSKSDVLGRELILDYVNLATSGKATDESVQALADKYLDKVPSLNQAATIKIGDIKTTFTSKASLQTYTNEFGKIERDYAARINKASGKSPSAEIDGTKFAEIGAAYTEAAAGLKGLLVPIAVLPQHLKLINSYLSSAAAMHALSEVDKDSSSAFAGIIALKANIDAESSLVQEIGQILTQNGIKI
ncbi:MAG: hypothetical protein JWN89_578 [Parcubacteria group bacterium]|nr:hypothetical protein [Parcubacteria group bacterium]